MADKITLKPFCIRCSAIGKIMGEPRGKSAAQKLAEAQALLKKNVDAVAAAKAGSKSQIAAAARVERYTKDVADLEKLADTPHLSQTCISYLQEWVNEQVYGRRIEVVSKYTTKGNKVEDDAIVYALGYVAGLQLEVKNEQHLGNDWMHGTPDVVAGQMVLDIKSSWSHETFPLYDREIPESDYEWQVLGYMGLTEKQKAVVCYCLMSMPDEMIEREARFKLGPNYTQEQFKEFAALYRYDDLPAFLRLKEFEFLFDEAKYESIKTRVEQCRAYIDEVIIPTLTANAKKYAEQ